jgi:hypothetical protein
MADLSSHSFVVRAADQNNVRGRAIRRVFVSNSVMKLANSSAGDLIVLAPGDSQTKVCTRLLSANTFQNSHLEVIRSRDDMAVTSVSR